MREITLNVGDLFTENNPYSSEEEGIKNILQKSNFNTHLSEIPKEVITGEVPVTKQVEAVNMTEASGVFKMLNLPNTTPQEPQPSTPPQTPSQETQPQEIDLSTTLFKDIQASPQPQPQEETQTPTPQEVVEYKNFEATINEVQIPISSKFDYTNYCIPIIYTPNNFDELIDLSSVVEELDTNIKRNGLNYVFRESHFKLNHKSLEHYNLEAFTMNTSTVIRYKEVPKVIERYQTHILSGILERINNSLKECKEENKISTKVNLTLNNIPLLTTTQLESIITHYKPSCRMKLLTPSILYIQY